MIIFDEGEGKYFSTKTRKYYSSQKRAESSERASERMKSHPEKYSGWKKENWPSDDTESTTTADTTTALDDILAQLNAVEENLDNGETEDMDGDWEEESNPFISWYDIPYNIRRAIHRQRSLSGTELGEELISNGFTGAHLNNIKAFADENGIYFDEDDIGDDFVDIDDYL